MASKRIQELDGLRAFAILSVIIYHLLFFKITGVLPLFLTPYLDGLGSDGVRLFFVISGFIITTLLLKEKEKTSDVNLKAFYLRRALRILPPLFVYLFVIGILTLCNLVYQSFSGILASIFFCTNLYLAFPLSPHNTLIGHTWTLSIEEQYYLFFPPLFLYLFHLNKKRATPFIILFILLCCISLNIGSFLRKFSEKWLYVCALYQFRFIAAGVLIAFWKDDISKWVTGKSIVFVFICVLLILIIPSLHLPSVISIIYAIIEPCLFGFILLWSIENPAKCGLLRSKILQWVGLASYSIYIWQQVFTAPGRDVKNIYVSNVILSVILIFITASLSYYFIEKPCINRIKRISQNK